MKSTYKILIASALMASSSAAAMAQASYSGYFLENYTHRYELNPALVDMSGHNNYFVAMPALGNFNVGFQGNLHLKDVLYNVNGQTVLFTNPNVSADAINKFGNKEKIGVNAEIDLLAVGFTAFGGKNVVTLGAVANANVMVPGSMFRFLKDGVENQKYDLSNVRALADGYVKLQFNHQRDLGQYVPGLKAGAAFKMLFGIASADANIKEAYLDLDQNDWRVMTNGYAHINMGNMHYKTKRSDVTGHEYVSGVDMDGAGVKGFGIGFDLGATYDWNDFQFSLALLDLGFISWGGTQTASTNGERYVNTNDYTFGITDQAYKDEWNDKLKPALYELYQFTDNGNTGSRTRSLRTTLNWGVQYELPYYRKLHFGLVNSTRFNGPFTATDFRFSANVRPVDCFSASANFSAGTYGVGFGWLANVNVKGFNFFLGMDRTFGKLAKQGVPLNSNGSLNLGMNFPF
ncbi:MAG: hypothetical protein K2F87_02795 [Muribaculaceae bacterium]|nr:hypothetical protein [Muribaculaceae bacterium]